MRVFSEITKLRFQAWLNLTLSDLDSIIFQKSNNENEVMQAI